MAQKKNAITRYIAYFWPGLNALPTKYLKTKGDELVVARTSLINGFELLPVESLEQEESKNKTQKTKRIFFISLLLFELIVKIVLNNISIK